MNRLLKKTTHWFVLFIFYCFCALPISCSNRGNVGYYSSNLPPTDSWAVYEGAWFTIEYPGNFDVVPSLKSSGKDGYDSVFFQDPEKRVRFYVLSPQWGRPASDIVIKQEVETTVSQEQRSSNSRKTLIKTIRAKDGSYERKIEENREQDGAVFWVFEIKYRNERFLKQNLANYQRFKDSLIQYTD